MKAYKALDKSSKSAVNNTFIDKVTGKKRAKSHKIKSDYKQIQKMVNQFVSKSKTRKAIKSIFPPSMYDNPTKAKRSTSRSRSKTKPNARSNLSAKKKAPLPPVREHKTAYKSVRSKTLRNENESRSKSKPRTSQKQRQMSSSKQSANSVNNRSKSNNRKQRSETRPNKTAIPLNVSSRVARQLSAVRPKSRPKSGKRSSSKPRPAREENMPPKHTNISLTNQKVKPEVSHGSIQNEMVAPMNYNNIPMYPKKIINNHINI